jgi:hypothetical protein
MLTLRVSQLDVYRAWCEEEESDLGWLLNALTAHEETEPMRRGSAFHKCLEMAQNGPQERLEALGYTFMFTADMRLALPEIREFRALKDYGGIAVTGKVDAHQGRLIVDHKSTARFEAEHYLLGYQWRLYLDIFECDRFLWNIFEMEEVDPKVYQVFGLHVLEQYRYPQLTEDCTRLAHDCRDFMKVYLPNYDVTPELELEEAQS